MVYVYCYGTLYHAIILSLHLTKVYYSCIRWHADVYYTMWAYIKHILYKYTLNERIPCERTYDKRIQDNYTLKGGREAMDIYTRWWIKRRWQGDDI